MYYAKLSLTDVDECNGENDCDDNATCNNTFGSYTCDCKTGYSGDGWNCTSMLKKYTMVHNCCI